MEIKFEGAEGIIIVVSLVVITILFIITGIALCSSPVKSSEEDEKNKKNSK